MTEDDTRLQPIYIATHEANASAELRCELHEWWRVDADNASLPEVFRYAEEHLTKEH